MISGGGGIVVLEELEHAKARGAKIYAELVGYGATADGDDMVAPSGEGAVRCMQHGARERERRRSTTSIRTRTSTPVGDIPEINAIREVFGEKMPPISATKSLTGHSQGAAGVHEAIYTLLMMQNGFICESANIEEIDPAVAERHIVRKRIDNAKIETALSNSFGFGGTNATLVFQRSRVNCAYLQRTGTPFALSQNETEDTWLNAGLMQGKRGLVMGVANDHSIAWGIARDAARATAPRSPSPIRAMRRPSACGRWPSRIGSQIVLPGDVENDAELDAVFDALKTRMGQARFPRPRHRLFRPRRTEGPLCRHHARQFLPHACRSPAIRSPRWRSAPRALMKPRAAR